MHLALSHTNTRAEMMTPIKTASARFVQENCNQRYQNSNESILFWHFIDHKEAGPLESHHCDHNHHVCQVRHGQFPDNRGVK